MNANYDVPCKAFNAAVTSVGCGAAVDSTRLITGSADSSAKLWDVETGANLFTFKHKAPCKAVAFSLGEGLAAIATDPFMTTSPAIHLVRIAEDAREQSADAVQARHGCRRVLFVFGAALLQTCIFVEQRFVQAPAQNLVEGRYCFLF